MTASGGVVISIHFVLEQATNASLEVGTLVGLPDEVAVGVFVGVKGGAAVGLVVGLIVAQTLSLFRLHFAGRVQSLKFSSTVQNLAPNPSQIAKASE